MAIEDPARRRLSARERPEPPSARRPVVTKSSGSPEHLGKAAVVTDDRQHGCAFSNFMQRLRPSRDMESKYLFWFLNSPFGCDQMNFFGSTTTGLRNLGASVLGGLVLPGAPAAVQCAIAAFLDRRTAAIDALITKKEREIELLYEKRQALITQAVTKGLDPNALMKNFGGRLAGRDSGTLASGADRLGCHQDHEWIRWAYKGHSRSRRCSVLTVVTHRGKRFDSIQITSTLVTARWSTAHAKSELKDGDVLVVQTGDIGRGVRTTRVRRL